MRKAIIIAGLAAACAGALPAVASADTRCVNPQTNATTGALVGAVGGAAVGSALAGRHSRGEGAVLGALGGAILGGAVGHSQTRCPDGYYAYDDSTRQYYDNSGAVYQPQGYAQPAYSGGGYNSGGPPPPPPGAYDNGSGYRGGGYGAYGRGDDFWRGAPQRSEDRIAFLETRIQRGERDGSLRPGEARRAYGEISNMRRYISDARSRNGGRMRPEDRQYVQDRLDNLSQRINWQRRY